MRAKVSYVFVAVVLALSVFVGLAGADVIDDVSAYVTSRPGKAGVYYGLQEHETKAAVGTAVVKDVVKNVDIDLLVAGSGKDAFNNDDKTVLAGLSYNVPLSVNSAISIGAAAGVTRVEKLQQNRLGEGTYGGYLLGKIKF